MAVVMGDWIVSFAVWGIADIFKGFGQSSLAKIGNTEISTEQFRQIYTDKLQQLGRSFGRPLTSEQARAFGLDRQVLQQTIAEAALDEEARRMGLAQSQEETMRLIYSDPNFKGLGGNFDPARFQATIRQFGYTEQRYLAEQRRVGLRRQIVGTVSAGVEPSKVLLDALIRYQNERCTPEDSPGGPSPERPLGARILKVALDLDALETREGSRAAGLEKLLARRTWYDPRIIAVLKSALAGDEDEESEIEIDKLVPGMIVAEDIRTTNGLLLVSAGQAVSEGMVQRLRNWARRSDGSIPLTVSIQDGGAAGEA